MRLFRYFVICCAIILNASSVAADERTEVGQCLSSKWNDMLRGRANLYEVFDMNVLAGKLFVSTYRTASPDWQQEARRVVAEAMKDALTEHLGFLQALTFSLGSSSGDFVQKKRAYQVAGTFTGRNGKTWSVTGLVSKERCKIMNMSIDGASIVDWLMATERISQFMKQYKIS